MPVCLLVRLIQLHQRGYGVLISRRVQATLLRGALLLEIARRGVVALGGQRAGVSQARMRRKGLEPSGYGRLR